MHERETFRQYLERLRAARELRDVRHPVDIRHIAALTAESAQALLFHHVSGYRMPVVAGLMRSAQRVALGMGVSNYADIEHVFSRGLAQPLPPVYVDDCPAREMVMLDGDADLFSMPIPMTSLLDGGPTITAGLTIVREPDGSLNAGIYRYMLKERNLTGIDIVTPNNLRALAQRAFEEGRPLPISISIGTHPFELMAATFRAPRGVDEIAIAGGLRGAPVALAMCETIDVPHVADAEIVLEAEILPTGWTWPEGRFGEFTWLMGGLHWNPLVRIKAISRRRDAIYYALHMPWEVTWMIIPARWSQLRTALTTAGVQVKDINVTLGGIGFWHVVISIRKQAGEGKNALLAALSVADIKHVVVVDEDIDVYNPTEVEWAIASRVQGDRDVIIVPGARTKPLDPSLLPMIAGAIPTGAKVGIDATIPEGVPRNRYQRISYAYADQVTLDNYPTITVSDDSRIGAPLAAEVESLAAIILDMIAEQPRYYAEVIDALPDHPMQAISRAFGKLHSDERLWQDIEGRMCVRGSKFAATIPG